MATREITEWIAECDACGLPHEPRDSTGFLTSAEALQAAEIDHWLRPPASERTDEEDILCPECARGVPHLFPALQALA